MQGSNEGERRAAYRESGRAVAAALIGFTLQLVSVLPLSEESGNVSQVGCTAFKERAHATFEELTFIATAGIWGESLAFSDEHPDVESLLSRLHADRARIDKGKLRLGLSGKLSDCRT